jgi:peptide chain release factor 2
MTDEQLRDLKQRLESAKGYLHYQELVSEVQKLEKEMAEEDFWSNARLAADISRRYNSLRADVAKLDELEALISDAEVLLEFADSGDEEAFGELSQVVSRVSRELDELEIQSLLGNEFDDNDAIAEIHSGAGGTDAQDWAEMMLRMYERWAEDRGFEFELDDVTPGQEAGILSATFIVKGRYAYGLLQAERGVHRLIRISPFDSQHRRHTSFASFDVTPLIEFSDEVEIDEKELRIDTYRSSGAGGQHVNKTDSAVRITHLPTGIVVSCQNERSQIQNRARAMQILMSKLQQRQREQFRAQMDALGGPQVEVAWASQIRSYFLAPYQLVKDHRSGYEDGNVAAVLDGRLDGFIEAYLKWRKTSGES